MFRSGFGKDRELSEQGDEHVDEDKQKSSFLHVVDGYEWGMNYGQVTEV